MNEFPLVTIGIPNYNYEKYIVDTLNSVANQTYPHIEVIIVDDFSKDNSCEVIEQWIANYRGNFSFRLIRNRENMGVSKVCNILLNNARGIYFQPLDADDILLPEKISNQVTFLNQSPETAMVYSNVSVINNRGIITNPDYCKRINYHKDKMPSGRIFENLLVFNFVSTPSVLIRTECARSVGGFDETIRLQDYYMWLKLSEYYCIAYSPEISAYYRVHDVSMSNFASTSCVLEESVMINKYRYYNQVSPELKKVIAKNLINSAVYLYQHNYPSASKWLRIAFQLKPSIPGFVYSLSANMGIPYAFFKKLKSLKP